MASSAAANNGAAAAAYAHGTIVEIHSLSSSRAKSLNLQLGEIVGGFDPETRRYSVHLLREKRRLAVKAENLRRPQRVCKDMREKSLGMAHSAAVKLAALQEMLSNPNAHATNTYRKDAKLLHDQALNLLFTALEDDPLNFVAYHTFGDMCVLQGRYADAVPHYRRAAENGGGEQSRQRLLVAVQNCGDAI